MTRHFPTDDEVARIARGLLDRSLPKALWTHAAHFAAALWLLRHEVGTPIDQRLRAAIRAYNETVGTPNTETSGYHETITLASIAAARAVLTGQPAARPLHEVVDVLMETPLGRSDWPLAHWTKARLFSPLARRAWVAPDLQPLPFEMD